MEKIRKTLYATLLIMVFLVGFAFTLAGNAKGTSKMTNVSDAKKGDFMNTDKETTKKALIVYFSWGGNTRYIAQKIQNKLDADIFELETVTPYPADYHQTTVVAKKEIENGVTPELKQNIDISEYDKIFVGTPAWWYTMAPAVRTFLTTSDFTGKTIIPFITHGGGGEYNIASEMGGYAKGSKVLKSISIYGKGNSDTDGEIDNWLKEIQ